MGEGLLQALVADELPPLFRCQPGSPGQFREIALHAFLYFLFVLAEQGSGLGHQSFKLFQRHGF